MSQQYPTLDFRTELVESARLLAINLHGANMNHRLKEDGSDLTDVDITNEALFLEKFGHLGIKIVSEEMEGLVNNGETTFLLLDPTDGTHALQRGQNTSSIGISYFENAVPRVSVAASLGVVAHYRNEGGEFIGFHDPRFSQGTMLLASEDGNFLSPLLVHNRSEVMPIRVPPIIPRPLTSSSTLLLNPCISAISSFHHGINAIGCESNIAAQMQVILGQAEGCLIGPRYSRSAKAGIPNPGSRLWDTIPTAVDNAGLVFVTLTGKNRGRVVPTQGLLSLCNENYEYEEQLLVCHPAHLEPLYDIWGILA